MSVDRCPRPGCRGHSEVLETRNAGRSRRRRLRCLRCEYRWTTREIADADFQRLLRVEDLGLVALLDAPKVEAG